MSDNGTSLDAVRAALRSETAVDLQHFPLELWLEEGVLTMTGELPSVPAKKLAMERAAALPGIVGIIDRLKVAPAQVMGDGAIRDELRKAFLQEPAFAAFAIRETRGGQTALIREPAARNGTIEYEVMDGVVTLNGEVPGLGHKRLAGVLAWWIPGSRDVINGIGENPPEQDNDDEVSDGVRTALEKDVFVNAGQIRVSTCDYVVTLDGQVATEAEKEMAERDAWYVFGVDKVVNKLNVRP